MLFVASSASSPDGTVLAVTMHTLLLCSGKVVENLSTFPVERASFAQNVRSVVNTITSQHRTLSRSRARWHWSRQGSASAARWLVP